ncbi:MAG: hypothetical protein M1821_007221 [Bathelium mastoideum]|nr:MAG: hypothetical protein M1821_007221 [Bathelium mastoideum]KAI9694726.1 MAG: hypothetical protein M1822_000342 [Bathelium mastoideum]
MCGRYVLHLRPSEVRRRMEEEHMPSQEAPDDGEVRQTYNFAPGYHGLVYRADVPDYGAGPRPKESEPQSQNNDDLDDEAMNSAAAVVEENQMTEDEQLHKLTANAENKPTTPSYKLQAMKWGLIPFWTKRNPDYGSMIKTINCRDDSLIENRGMWTTMKQRKRCIVVCEGFYEWLKKHGGKERIPHFVKRKDGQLMCFAGLWDCAQYEGSEEKLYTYSIITTNSNKQLQFLHDRMPVILENGSDEVSIWLDPGRAEWSKELQSLLKPYPGDLECYPVSKDVGKVGNNSASFIIPLDSSENKNNIANFFENQKRAKSKQGSDNGVVKSPQMPKDDHGATLRQTGGDSTATVTSPVKSSNTRNPSSLKREHSSTGDGVTASGEEAPWTKSQKMDDLDSIKEGQADVSQRAEDGGPLKAAVGPAAGKKRSATSNASPKGKRAAKEAAGSRKITSFFAQ